VVNIQFDDSEKIQKKSEKKFYNLRKKTEKITPFCAQTINDQFEIYFGYENIIKNEILQEEMKKDCGWIPIETIIKFKRLKALSTDIDQILKILTQSRISEVWTFKKKVRRSNNHQFEETLKKI
jgi:lupus La protein